jgi:hypothetical protein
MKGFKKARVQIIINEDGDPNIDILNATGPSCAKEAKDWADLSGGAKSIQRKPEFFKQGNKEEQKNFQKRS